MDEAQPHVPKLRTIGWREWVSLPALKVPRVKVKVDTGARSSSLHAIDVEQFERDGIAMVRFKVHPVQRSLKNAIATEAVLLEQRSIRSSSGESEVRPVIRTSVHLFGRTWNVDLTLTNRNEMGFRMLLGREAIRGRFLVDSANSYLARKHKHKGPS